MKEELIKLIKYHTMGDAMEFAKRDAKCPKRVNAAAISIMALLHGKPNQFLQYLQLEIDNKDKHVNAKYEPVGDNKFKIVYESKGESALGELLREKLHYYENMKTADFYAIDLYESEEKPLLDCVAYALLRHMHIPTVLNKVLAIFDIVPEDDTIEVKTW